MLYFVILFFFFAFLLLEPGYHMHCKDNVIKVRFSLTFKDTVIFILVSVTKSTTSTMTGKKY